MSTPIPIAQQLQQTPWPVRLRQIFRSHWTFAALQILDLLTTLAAFRVGALEINPLVAYFARQFGRFGGVLISKLFAILIAFGVRRLIWIVNIFYTAVVCWNVVILILLFFKAP
jgi:uncharacterized protein DUF5658